MLQAIDGWHPAVVQIVAQQDLDTIFRIPFAYVEPLAPWAPSRVTLIGDAAHAMLPTLGMGANTALNDARLLLDALARQLEVEVSDEELAERIGRILAIDAPRALRSLSCLNP